LTLKISYQLAAVWRFLYINGLLALRRQTTILISISLAPFTFIYFLYLVSPRSELPFGIVGAIVFTTVFTGNAMLNDAAYFRLEHHIQELYVASPINAISYVSGLAFSELAFTLPPLAFLFIIMELTIHASAVQLAVLAGIVLLTWAMATSLGFMISSFFREFREIWPIASLVFNTISIIPPVFYPVTVIPVSIRWLAYAAPTTYSALLADSTLGLLKDSSPALYLAGLVVSTLIFIAIASVFTRWREK
jgi:ABC-2 type transport system permease protein